MSYFILNTTSLATTTKASCEHTTYLKILCSLLQFLPKSCKFWTRVAVDSSDKNLIDIETCIENMNCCYDFGSKSTLTGTVTGGRETFYCHVEKCYITRLAKETFDIFGYGVGIWTIQGFKNRNNQSIFVYK